MLGIGKLFAGIKRVFHIHEDILSLHAIQAVNTMIKHSDLVQPLLDSDLVELIYDSLCASTDERIIKYVVSFYVLLIVLFIKIFFFYVSFSCSLFHFDPSVTEN